MPAEQKNCEADALGRWQRRGFALPPCPYRTQCCMTRPNEVWEPPNATEQEILMGYRKHRTTPAAKSGFAKANPQQADRIRISLLGNSFSVGVVAWLLSWWAAGEGLSD
eukprot:3940990-Karenia_brevis.AAC.1